MLTDTKGATREALLEPFINCTSTQSVIGAGLAAERLDALRNSPKLDTLLNVWRGHIPQYEVNIESFVTLLRQFTGRGYNGIRVYIACFPVMPVGDEHKWIPPNRLGQMTLLFVPTVVDADHPETGKDVPDQFWTFDKDDIPQPLSQPGSPSDDFVTRWIRNYRDGVMAALERDGKREFYSGFQETRSLWYDIRLITGVGSDPGLIEYIRCARGNNNNNRVISLLICFAAFHKDETAFPAHQLTLIFRLNQRYDPLLRGDHKSLLFANSYLGSSPNGPDKVIPVDTGIPCPPAGNCENGDINIILRQNKAMI